MRVVFATSDINSSDDLKGMKLRINPTPVYRDFYQMLGAAPTPIPTPDAFDAMTNGQVDGLEAVHRAGLEPALRQDIQGPCCR